MRPTHLIARALLESSDGIDQQDMLELLLREGATLPSARIAVSKAIASGWVTAKLSLTDPAQTAHFVERVARGDDTVRWGAQHRRLAQLAAQSCASWSWTPRPQVLDAMLEAREPGYDAKRCSQMLRELVRDGFMELRGEWRRGDDRRELRLTDKGEQIAEGAA